MIWKSTLSEKDSYAQYLLYATLVSYVAIVGAVLWQLPFRDIFCGFYNFLSFMSAQAFMNAKTAKNIPTL